MKRLLKFRYRNYKNEEADRCIVVDVRIDDQTRTLQQYAEHQSVLIYRLPDPDDKYHPGGGILLSGFDLDKQARRSFELRRIISQIIDEEYNEPATT